ncbi:hypothetical protein JB92DRAFT_3137164 [Gautieria morchelliformis]|nr:hypothetical protein JB92DRAFT_3137164 [Gautieria morchelliformis]
MNPDRVNFDCSNAPAFRALTRSTEGSFKIELTLLESVLLGHTAQVPGSGAIGYFIESFKYDTLLEHLSRVALDRKDVLQSVNLPPPSLPTLPQWSTNSLWNSKELEVLFVTLREDIANFLAFYWDIVAKTKGPFKPAKDETVSPPLPDIAEMSSNMEIFRLHYLAAHKALSRKMAAGNLVNKAKSNTVQEFPALEHDHPPHSTIPVREALEPILAPQ